MIEPQRENYLVMFDLMIVSQLNLFVKLEHGLMVHWLILLLTVCQKCGLQKKQVHAHQVTHSLITCDELPQVAHQWDDEIL
jgi:hypothetical protein